VCFENNTGFDALKTLAVARGFFDEKDGDF
jgi:hypothetical protein